MKFEFSHVLITVTIVCTIACLLSFQSWAKGVSDLKDNEKVGGRYQAALELISK